MRTSVGLGIGSAAYAMAQDRRLERVDCVEICGGEKVLCACLLPWNKRRRCP